jgi:hypothetical protein
MSSYKKIYSRILRESIKEDYSQQMGMKDDVDPYMGDRQSEEDAFRDELDPTSDGSEYDVEPSSVDVGAEIATYLGRYSKLFASFRGRLLNPQNPDALLTKLAEVAEIPEYANAAETVAKQVKKAVESLSATQAELDTLVTMAVPRKNKRMNSGKAEI